MKNHGLTQDYDAHVLFTFAAVPAKPLAANIAGRARRWFVIAFAESWLAVLLFRTKKRAVALHIPVLGGLFDLVSRALFGVYIGSDVEIGPGLMITHGGVVIDGRVRIGRNCQINPWVTIGLSNSRKLGFSIEGPTIGDNVHIGTGAKVLGPITIGDHARIGANAVVVRDVPANVTVVGVPAHVIARRAPAWLSGMPEERVRQRMRAAIVDYKLKRRSLRSLVDVLLQQFDLARAQLAEERAVVQDDLIFLDAIAATGGGESRQVTAAIDAIERALTPEQERLEAAS